MANGYRPMAIKKLPSKSRTEAVFRGTTLFPPITKISIHWAATRWAVTGLPVQAYWWFSLASPGRHPGALDRRPCSQGPSSLRPMNPGTPLHRLCLPNSLIIFTACVNKTYLQDPRYLLLTVRFLTAARLTPTMPPTVPSTAMARVINTGSTTGSPSKAPATTTNSMP